MTSLSRILQILPIDLGYGVSMLLFKCLKACVGTLKLEIFETVTCVRSAAPTSGGPWEPVTAQLRRRKNYSALHIITTPPTKNRFRGPFFRKGLFLWHWYC